MLSLVSLAVLAGCSEDGGGSTAATSSAAKEPEPRGFAAQADALCATAMAQQEDLRRKLGGDQITLDDRARLLVALAPPRVELADGLAALQPPAGKEAEVAELVEAARRRADASALAGMLWEQDGPRADIAAAAAAEHDQRERFVELARELDLGACGEILSRPERRPVVVASLEAFSADPRKRCGGLGRRLAEQEYGGRRGCFEPGAEPLAPVADGTAVVREIEGVDEVFALTRVETPAGEFRVRLTYEDGSYKVDKVD